MLAACGVAMSIALTVDAATGCPCGTDGYPGIGICAPPISGYGIGIAGIG